MVRVLFEKDGNHLLVTKGALRQILSVCTRVERSDGSLAKATSALPEIERCWREFGDQGRRVLGIAYREFGPGAIWLQHWGKHSSNFFRRIAMPS